MLFTRKVFPTAIVAAPLWLMSTSLGMEMVMLRDSTFDASCGFITRLFRRQGHALGLHPVMEQRRLPRRVMGQMSSIMNHHAHSAFLDSVPTYLRYLHR